MALQVWLPLKGNLNNSGAASVTVTNYGATATTDGTIQCYEFNGSSWIRITKPSNMTTLKNTSVSAFVKSTSSTLALGGISNDLEATEAGMTLYTSGWQFIGSNTYKYAPSGTIANTLVWHHVCCVMTDTNIITYLDGAQVDNVTIASVGVDKFDLTANTFIEIGCDHPGGDEYLTGFVSDFRVYNHALSAAEVKAIYEAHDSTIVPTNFTDSNAFNNSSSLYIKEIHVDELQNAVARLQTYLPNVDNCTGLICQSCQNVCVNCTNTNQSCQTAGICQSNCGNQSCQNGCYCQSCQI